MSERGLAGVVCESAAMRELLGLLGRLANARSPVLLEGESGTGKDLLAHWLHYLSPRREAPFVKVHCPSIPEELLESELFGYEKGAFTDAAQPKRGKLELADSGTLYFDQVQDLSLTLQAKLLRAVEECRFERLGGTSTISVDLRFVCSTTGELRRAVEAGRFREDLYHRLAVVPLRVPPLRERRDDILPLAQVFLGREHGKRGDSPRRLSPEATGLLHGYEWPGNVRELRGVVERAVLLELGAEIRPESLPAHLSDRAAALWEGRERHPTLRDVEQSYIRFILDKVEGNQTRAAAILGVSRKALWEKRRRFGMA